MLESSLPKAMAGTPQTSARSDLRRALALGVAVAEMAAIAISTYLAFIVYHLVVWSALPDTIAYGWICTGLALIYGIICLADKQYDSLGAEWNHKARSRGALALALAFVFLLAFMFLTGAGTSYSRGTFLAQLAVALPAQLTVRTLSQRALDVARKSGHWTSGVLVLVFPGVEKPMRLLESLSTRPDEIRRIHYLDRDASASELRRILRDSRTLHCESVLLLFGSDSMDAVSRAAEIVSEMPVRVQLLPISMLQFMHCSRIGFYGRARVFELASGPSWVMDVLLKRSFDLIVATVAGLLLLPLMLIVAVLIKLDSRGPVLFQQIRHGYNNKPIKVLKFRTMFSCEEREFRQATRDDPRVTRVGRILRRTNIDELPQLLNVIRGDMSIVGPRPHAVSHNETYDGQIARMSRRHNVKPGITGWAQVNGLRGETDTFEKMRARVEHDLYYIDNWSLAFDLKILLMTIFSKKIYDNAY
ncbi:MAG: exopolysaccharide biosynthesis polyprenyl glycosylphosphotransferase [Bradyrhizobium sp.]|uniref:exopolysaccharide biosynthesis polyprenyl glycosylphosphotransferase n=1 Tax=Bradyrhizobium sp. TaxID=376 RepID=UPI0025C19C59|nr:exopolysaccharide biosynthesis polyprenyl glycosylphosphotransferase [Bradyrhizobium sp.]MBI5260642.1 exopolysaccharide biosynthesis polyprenyl glycosylphosphotransferase [Bradyrhizobium sp.]